tara:strand:- start:65 stop:352 length:288 start_codon:yes stop_codon:yes gene_type:complete
MKQIENLTKVLAGIQKLSNDEIDTVVQKIKQRRNQLAVQSAQSLNKGDRVSFTSHRSGAKMKGTVRKVNIKYVIVDIDGTEMAYKVPGSMLKKVA